jgi:hypothetical protein
MQSDGEVREILVMDEYVGIHAVDIASLKSPITAVM